MGDVLRSSSPADHRMLSQVFGEAFQRPEGWHNHFQHLGHAAGSSLANADRWDVKSFQALFVAAWATQPTEKGTYMIDLSGLSHEQLSAIKNAQKQHLAARPSSHLSGKGGSASKSWHFLKGYKELLVQVETINHKPYLMLKTEGHTTKPQDIVPHMMGWVHKVRTGEGKTASPALNAVAKNQPGLVEARAAENYSNDYGKLLSALGLKPGSKTVTTRQMAQKLFDATGFTPKPGTSNQAFLASATNAELGRALQAYGRASRPAQGTPLRNLGKGGRVDDAMLAELGQVARSLVADGDTIHGRVFREVILSPAQLDDTMKKFAARTAAHAPSQGTALPGLQPASHGVRPHTAPEAGRPAASSIGGGRPATATGARLGSLASRATGKLKSGIGSASAVVGSLKGKPTRKVMVMEGFYGGQATSLRLSQNDVQAYAKGAAGSATLRGFLDHKIRNASATTPSDLKITVNGEAQGLVGKRADQFLFTDAADVEARFQRLLRA